MALYNNKGLFYMLLNWNTAGIYGGAGNGKIIVNNKARYAEIYAT
jgi:hypothetical protein